MKKITNPLTIVVAILAGILLIFLGVVGVGKLFFSSTTLDAADYDSLYKKYIRSIDVGMIFNENWEDANQIEPEYFIYYFFIEKYPPENGSREFDDDIIKVAPAEVPYEALISAEALERFVKQHFDVTTEHLRSTDYYLADYDAYGFGGIGSTWELKITKATQTGNRLTIDYNVIGPQGTRTGEGSIQIKNEKNGFKYCSNKFERSAEYYLEYPNSIQITQVNDGVITMNSGEGECSTGSAEDNTARTYVGNDLSVITGYYLNEALPALAANGTAQMSSDGNSWSWNGTYRNGIPLTISIVPAFGSDIYDITIAYEKGADIPVASEIQNIALDDKDSLSNRYLYKPFFAGMLDNGWAESNAIAPQSLVNFYAAHKNVPTQTESRFPANEVEPFLQKYFDISDIPAAAGQAYNPQKKEYTALISVPEAELWCVNATQVGDILTLGYEACLPESKTDVLWRGDVKIKLERGGFKYISNDVRQGLLAKGPVPNFLDTQQQILYRKAKTAFEEFTYYNGGFDSRGDENSPGPALEKNDMSYYECNGNITTWTDFVQFMLSALTADYYEELNDGASYTDGAGVFYKRTIFTEDNGKLYYSGGARGGDITFVAPEKFELISKDNEKIQFYVVGTYDDFASDADGSLIATDNGDYLRAGKPTEEKRLIEMVKTQDGWRFSKFALAY